MASAPSKWGIVAARTTTDGGGGGEGDHRNKHQQQMPPQKRVTGGAMIMKSVSIFLANGRRGSKSGLRSRNKLASHPTVATAAATAASHMTTSPDVAQKQPAAQLNKRARRPKVAGTATVEDASGKINPKLLELYKKRTHFSK